MLSRGPDSLREPPDRLARCGRRNPATREDCRSAPGKAYHRQAAGHCLGDDPRSLVMKAWEQENVRLLAHQSQCLFPRTPSKEMHPFLEAQFLCGPFETMFVGSGTANVELPVG